MMWHIHFMSVLTCNLMHDHEFDWIPNPWIPDRIHNIGDCNQAGWFEKRRENCQKPTITVEALLTSFPAAVFCLRTDEAHTNCYFRNNEYD